MKKCPQCGREYDASMMFCLDDGARLLYGPTPAQETGTGCVRSSAFERFRRIKTLLTEK